MTTTVHVRPDDRHVVKATRQIHRVVQRAPRPSKPAGWPRPPLVHDHRVLFREAAYQDGQPYADDLEDDEDV